jgi:ABC-type antimicrobial peptide transport system ATPase subunit
MAITPAFRLINEMRYTLTKQQTIGIYGRNRHYSSALFRVLRDFFPLYSMPFWFREAMRVS